MTDPRSTRSNRRFVQVDGLRIRVFVHDDRPAVVKRADSDTVVLLHGAGGNYLIWPPAMRRMSGLRIIAPDLPGHGESDGDGYADAGQYAAFVRRLLRTLCVERTVLVGHSLGAAISLACAHEFTEAIAAIGILAGGELLPVSDDLLGNSFNNFGEMSEVLAKELDSAAVPPVDRDDWMARMRNTRPDVLRFDLAASRAFDARPYAATLDVPALIIAGGEDDLVPLSSSCGLHRRMPQSELHVLDGAGHMFLWDHTEEVRRLLRRFVTCQVRPENCQ